jgi:spore maturation protein CgeB
MLGSETAGQFTPRLRADARRSFARDARRRRGVKILYLGEIGCGQTALMRMRALERLGHTVRGVRTMEPWKRASWIHRQVQRRVHRGSVVEEINLTVLSAARQFKPALVWADKQEFLSEETVEELRSLGAKTVHFTPDPYFSLEWKRTALMDAAMRAFDVLVYCKSYERAQYERLGKPVVYMPLGYCDEVHRPLASEDARWSCAVGFLGGWEPRRERLLHAVSAAGIDLKIWGGYWEFLRDGKWTPRRHIILRQLAGRDRFRFHRDELLSRAHQGGEVYADDYARALTGSRIGLGFVRKVCPDQHTTRTFEIPACGSLLLADRTEEHQEFFEEGKEAEFFGSCDELLDKLKFYCSNEPARKRVADGGYRRCKEGGYAYVCRLRTVLDVIKQI